jgi:hypothetical protein
MRVIREAADCRRLGLVFIAQSETRSTHLYRWIQAMPIVAINCLSRAENCELFVGFIDAFSQVNYDKVL